MELLLIQLQQIFESGYPHRVCLQNDPVLMTGSFIGSIVTFFAYSYLSVWWFNRRNILGEIFGTPGLAVLFGMFILLCGIAHALYAVTLFVPMNLVTVAAVDLMAIVSLGTAFALFRATTLIDARILRISDANG